jgi:N-acetylglucosamine kinase-like BadF-type ATPase
MHEAALRAALFGKCKAAWNLHTLDEFVRAANSTPDFAALFPAVSAAADAGDPLAERVFSQAGRELAQLSGIIVQRLFADSGLSTIPLAMIGGVFRHAPLVRNVFREEVCRLDSRVAVDPQMVQPVAGALQMARAGKITLKAREVE